MIVVGERVAGEALDPVGLQLAVEAVAHDPLLVRDRLGIALGVGAVAGEVPAAPALVAVVDRVGR